MESIKGNSNFHRTKALYIQIPQDKMPTQQHSLVHYVIKWFLAQKKNVTVFKIVVSVHLNMNYSHSSQMSL